MSKPAQDKGLLDSLANWVNGLSRSTRIVVNMMISLAVMALVGLPIVLLTAGNAADTSGGEVLYAPTIAIAVVWLLVYGMGWSALVGFDWDDENPWQANRSASWMLILGMIAGFLLLFGCLYGFLFALVL